MADRSAQLLLEGLSRLAGQSAPLPLLGKDAIFPATAAGKEAARLCKDQNLITVVRTEGRGKSSVEYCRITPQGMEFLTAQQSPRQALENLVDTLEARQDQLDSLVSGARQSREELKELRTFAEVVLRKLEQASVAPPPPAMPQQQLPAAILTHLDMWQAAEALDDFPLPELYERVNHVSPTTIGQFHDALRELLQQHKLYLHPWTGPLYALPQPQFALLVGHQVAYYASLRGSQSMSA